jgi:hypothetical protein
LGYKNEHAYRGHAAGDEKYYRAWIGEEQGQRALVIASGRGVSPSELKQQLIAARNARPHASGRIPGSPGKSGGNPYYQFMEDYGMYDREDWVDY